ncbi:DUF3999 family protein [Petrachloros mirabilis]
MRLIGGLVTFVLLIGATETPAQESERWQAWQYSRDVLSRAATEAGLVRIPLSTDVYAHAQSDLGDLRVIDEAGTEVPFLLHAVHARQTRSWRDAQLTDAGFVPGQFTEVIVDAGLNERHNLLELQFDEADFFSWVEIASSDDRTTWRIIRDRAPLYRFHDDDGERVPSLSYPQTYARWLRVRVLDKDKKLTPRWGRVAHEIAEQAEYTPAPVTVTKEESASPRQSQWNADFGNAKIPLSAFRFEAAQPEFHRAIRIATSTDGKTWKTRCRGEIYRYRPLSEKAGEQTSLEISFLETQVRYWRVTVLDRDDAPVIGLRVIPLQVVRSIVFRQDPAHRYRVLYGHGRSKPAQYDLKRLVSSDDLKTAADGQLGSEEQTKNHVSAEPWTEQHPVLLWGALLTVMSVLGYQAIRAMG